VRSPDIDVSRLDRGVLLRELVINRTCRGEMRRGDNWGDNSHSAKGPRGQSKEVTGGFSVRVRGPEFNVSYGDILINPE
jgi:hypothetical protein